MPGRVVFEVTPVVEEIPQYDQDDVVPPPVEHQRTVVLPTPEELQEALGLWAEAIERWTDLNHNGIREEGEVKIEFTIPAPH